jgi:hypothetical protein
MQRGSLYLCLYLRLFKLNFYSIGDIGLLNYLFSVKIQFVAPLCMICCRSYLPNYVKNIFEGNDHSTPVSTAKKRTNCDSSVRMVASLGSGLLQCRRSTPSKTIFISSPKATGLKQSPVEWVPGTLALRVERPGSENNHSQ